MLWNTPQGFGFLLDLEILKSRVGSVARGQRAQGCPHELLGFRPRGLEWLPCVCETMTVLLNNFQSRARRARSHMQAIERISLALVQLSPRTLRRPRPDASEDTIGSPRDLNMIQKQEETKTGGKSLCYGTHHRVLVSSETKKFNSKCILSPFDPARRRG